MSTPPDLRPGHGPAAHRTRPGAPAAGRPVPAAGPQACGAGPLVLLGWVTLLVVSGAAVAAAGDTLPSLTADPAGLWQTATTTDPVRTALALVRVAVLAVDGYLLAVTAAGLLTRASGRETAVRVVDQLTVPSVRRLLGPLAVSTVMVTLAVTAGRAGPASAQVGPGSGPPATPVRPTTTAAGEPAGGDGAAVVGPPVMRYLGPDAHDAGGPSAGDVGRHDPGVPLPAPSPPPTPTPAPASPEDGSPASGPDTGSPSPPSTRPPEPASPVDPAQGADDDPGRSLAPGVAPPADASTGAERPPSDPDEGLPPDHWTIEPGDHLWHVAEATLAARWGRTPSVAETAGYHRLLIEANTASLVVPGEPDLVLPGQVFHLPPVPTAAAPPAA